MDTKSNKTVDDLAGMLTKATLPSDILTKLNEEIARARLIIQTQGFNPEVDRLVGYVKFVASLPWNKEGQDILDLNRAKQVLNKNHHGLEPIKERILEFLSVLILNSHKGVKSKQPSLAFVGLVGSGKTSLAYSIAESLGRPIVRIPFGGLGSALQLRGESRVKPEAEPGFILRALAKAQVKNPVILLDELDRVAQEFRNDIMGVLVEMLDPEQNSAFLDHYVSYPFDLSGVLFIATANNLANVATAVIDRLEVIEMPFYSDEQKVVIGRDYILPQILTNDGLDPKILLVDPAVWPAIVRPLGYDGGIRSLKRNLENIVGKIAKKVVEGQPGPFQINEGNLSDYL